ncbi:MFS transporter [Moorella sulfitireducens]|uniref:MFS transporter n=1 Tax=Neomoorella sulfitireducens TaxID=2972948 RepID=UPI0021ABEC47|nr:MFS transporter [Moorella sulfitireducens]
MKVNWKRNVIILAFSEFLIRGMMTLIRPFISLYLPELGVSGAEELAFWTGVLTSVNFVAQALVSPVWGILADRYGRKYMVLRCVIFMGIFNLFLAAVGNVYQFLVLRFLMGAISGFNAAAIAMVATTTPDEHMGYAVGMIQTGFMAGTIFGPAVGGIIADFVGYRGSFIVAGIVILILTPLLIFGVQEEFSLPTNADKKTKNNIGIGILKGNSTVIRFLIIIIIAQFSIQSADAFIPLFVQDIYRGKDLNLVVSLIYGATAVASVIMAPMLGKLGDVYGGTTILVICLLGLGVTTLPQALLHDVILLGGLRLVAGVFVGGIVPSINAVIAKTTNQQNRGSVLGLSASATAIGNFAGPMLGGILAAKAGIAAVFMVAGTIVIVTATYLFFIRNQEKYKAYPVPPGKVQR